MDISAVCEKIEQAAALEDLGLSIVFHPGNTLPYVFRDKDKDICMDMLNEDHVLARSMDGIGFLKSYDYKGTVYADHYLYTYNKASRDLLLSLGISHDTAPLELTYRELAARGMKDSSLLIYGRAPMMISAGCLYRNTENDRCEKNTEKGHDLILKDRMNTDFPVICSCRYCYNIILNSVPISLHNHMDKIKSLGPESVRLYFTTESEKETKETAEYFIRLIKNGEKKSSPPFDRYTNGHFIHKVE